MVSYGRGVPTDGARGALVTVAQRAFHADTNLIEERSFHVGPSSKAAVVFVDAGATGGFAYRDPFRNVVIGSPFSTLRQSPKLVDIIFPSPKVGIVDLQTSDPSEFTMSLSATPVQTRIGTGEFYSSDPDRVIEAWYRHRFAPAPTLTEATTLTETSSAPVLDIPEALGDARTRAGLPVQDLAAMFGIKRRQFYNLISGEDMPDAAREKRIGRVADALRAMSDQLGGNSRSVRTLLLARIEGDSVYDAAVADEPVRLELALERALAAAAAGQRVQPRAAPSIRASAEEAAAARDFLSATRDDTGPETTGA